MNTRNTRDPRHPAARRLSGQLISVRLGRLLLATTLVTALTVLAACSGDGGLTVIDEGDEGCVTADLPFSSSEPAPEVTDVTLDVQDDQRVVLLATITDPQGDENIQNIEQTISVFRDNQCQTTTVTLTDDFACSGCEESFGALVTLDDDEQFFQAINASAVWPVEVDIQDADGNTTSGQLLAEVER